VVLAAYFIESGLILVVAPWSSFWDRNGFTRYLPLLEPVLASPFVRGAVSGIGAITAVAGLAELGGLFGRRDRASRQPAPPLER
jgi:hypothetical protein